MHMYSHLSRSDPITLVTEQCFDSDRWLVAANGHVSPRLHSYTDAHTKFDASTVSTVSMLRLTGTLSEPLEYEHVKTALGDTRPARLAIAVARVSAFGDITGPVLRDPSAQQLRAMEAELFFSPAERDVGIRAVLNDVAMTLAILPLHCVALTLNYDLLSAQDDSSRRRRGCSGSCPMVGDAEDLNIVATQALFRTAIPSLVADVVVQRLSTDRAS
ncbi:hypothetical protein V8D89_001245 [Ganoderma adspersum]